MKSYLLDTHAFLWAGLESGKLPKRIRKIFEASSSSLFLSMASVWEMSIKKSLGKLRIPVPLRTFIEEVAGEAGVAILPVEFSHAIGIEEVERIHGDPFDRMLVCQARHERLTILSNDDIFDEYKVARVW